MLKILNYLPLIQWQVSTNLGHQQYKLFTNQIEIGHKTKFVNSNAGCKFYPIGENRRFERVAENLAVGSELFKIEAHPRSEFKIEPVDNSLSDVNYFKFVDLDDRFVAIKLNQSLEELVDRVSLAINDFKQQCNQVNIKNH